MEGPGLILPAANPWPRWKSGNYYSAASNILLTSSTGTFALVADRIYTVPLWVPYGESVDQVGCNVSSAAAAGKLLRLGAFAEGDDGIAGGWIDGSGTIAADATGAKTYTLAAPIAGGRILHVAVWSDGAPTLSAVAAGVLATVFGESTPGGWTRNFGFYHSLAFGAWPALFGSADGSIGTTGPILSARAV